MPNAYGQVHAQDTLSPRPPSGEPDDDRLQLLKSILADPRWSCPPAVRGELLQVLASVGGTGRASEHAWITLAEELARYLLCRRTGHAQFELTDWQHRRTHKGPALQGRVKA